jgi:hypothetical protein
LEGQVKGAPGIFVMAWGLTAQGGEMRGEPRLMVADIEGRFSFPGLAPGDYRLLASYDQSVLDPETLGERYPVNAGKATVVELSPVN